MQSSQIQVTRTSGIVSVQAPFSETNNNEYRSRGGKFDRSTGTWRFPESPAVDKMLDELYGSSEKIVTVTIPYTGHIYNTEDALREYGNIVQLGGYVLINRRGRDYQVDFAPGVVLFSGRFKSSGGSVKHPCVGDPVEPVTLHVSVREDFALRHGLDIIAKKSAVGEGTHKQGRFWFPIWLSNKD